MSRRRRLLALAALVGMLSLSGCLGFFGAGPVSDERLDQAPAGSEYDWTESVDSELNAHTTRHAHATFSAVHAVTGREDAL